LALKNGDEKVAQSSLSPRVKTLLSASREIAVEARSVRNSLDAYLTDGVDAERTLSGIALALTHRRIDDLEAAVGAFGGVQ
jgi:hypothetical protein